MRMYQVNQQLEGTAFSIPVVSSVGATKHYTNFINYLSVSVFTGRYKGTLLEKFLHMYGVLDFHY